MEIDFIQKKDPATDVVTTKCKIKHLIILSAVIDPSANFAIMTDDIAKWLNLRIDTSERHDLKGVTTVHNVKVEFKNWKSGSHWNIVCMGHRTLKTILIFLIILEEFLSALES